MRIAFLLERFPVLSETFVTTQMRGLQRAGHAIDVVAQERPRAGEPVHDEVARSALVDRTHYADVRLTPDSLDPVPSIPLAPGHHDVLHAHFGPSARRFVFARGQADAPLVVTFHGYDFSAEPCARGRAMYETLFATADLVTFNCEHARLALDTLGCPAHKLVRLRMPVVVDEFAFRARRLRHREVVRILTVGRLVEKKGHVDALRAIAEAARVVPLRYDVVGGGPLAERLAALVRELRLERVVRLHGARDSTHVRRLLDGAHLFLLASAEAADGDSEGTPVALLEAQACGLPVVSTLHAGIPEVVVDGCSGLLVPEHDPRALADALLRLMRDNASWPALGARGRAHVEQRFDVVPCTRTLLGVYARAASGRLDGHEARRRAATV